MEGPSDSLGNREMMGMIPRGVLQIYEHTNQLKSKGWQYAMEGSFLEIYNETIRDLLAADDTNNSTTAKKHDIKHLPGTNKTVVTDLTTRPLQSSDEVFSLLKTAARNRRVAETLCNERSSRSHSVFMLKISGHNEVTNENCEGVLNLIDLGKFLPTFFPYFL
jgi:kinesin family protein C1